MVWRVIIAHNEALVRERTLTTILNANYDVLVVAQVTSVPTLLSTIPYHYPCILILGELLEDMPIYDLTKRINWDFPRWAHVVLVADALDEELLFKSIHSGVKAVVQQSFIEDQLIQALDNVRQSRVYIPDLYFRKI